MGGGKQNKKERTARRVRSFWLMGEVVITMVDICLAANEACDEWDENVNEYAQEHKCSREVAEKNVTPLKNILDGTMIFFTQEWVARALETQEIHARSKIAIISAVLALIPEQSLREWGRTLRGQRE